jgi:hypothetical protein
VAVVQYTYTHKQYTEYREQNIHAYVLTYSMKHLTKKLGTLKYRSFNGSSSLSPAFHLGGTGPKPGEYMWDLWWTMHHWNEVPSEYFLLSQHTFYLHVYLYAIHIIKSRLKITHPKLK